MPSKLLTFIQKRQELLGQRKRTIHITMIGTGRMIPVLVCLLAAIRSPCSAATWRRLQSMYQATEYFEQNAHFVSADVSEVDYQFATEPITAVKPAEQQVNEEELLSSFEQAVSDRMEAISACANRVSEPLTHQPNTTGDRDSLVPARSYLSPRQGSSALPKVLAPLAGTRGAGIWSSLLSNPWRRGIILASLSLLLLMSGFDLMGVLVLLMR